MILFSTTWILKKIAYVQVPNSTGLPIRTDSGRSGERSSDGSNLRGLFEFCYGSDMMRNLSIKFENGFLTAKKAMSSNQALLGRSTASTDSTSKLSIEDRQDNESLRHQFNLIKSATEKDSLTRGVDRTRLPMNINAISR